MAIKKWIGINKLNSLSFDKILKYQDLRANLKNIRYDIKFHEKYLNKSCSEWSINYHSSNLSLSIIKLQNIKYEIHNFIISNFN
jgi:hypothetical protein